MVSAASAVTSDSANSLDFVDEVANRRCFECHAPLDSPNWVSVNLGVLLCISCSGLHRNLGVHVSKVRSLQLDRLPSSQLDILRRLGNNRAAKIWEHQTLQADDARSKNLALFVQNKYVSKLYLSELSEEASPEVFERVILEDSLKRVAWFVAHGRPPFYIGQQKTTALHVAASEPTISATMCEFLLLNGGDLMALDENGKTPSDIANEKGSSMAQSVFRSWAASSFVKSPVAEEV
jgi:hypothetical protein